MKNKTRLIMLRLDGEVWEIGEDYDTDVNSVSCRLAKQELDSKAIAAGITHIQTFYGGKPFHEIEKIK